MQIYFEVRQKIKLHETPDPEILAEEFGAEPPEAMGVWGQANDF